MTKQLKDDPSQEAHRNSESPEAAAIPAPPNAPKSPRVDLHVDDSSAAVCYANFCRVTGTPEELILDFGLNAQPMGSDSNVAVTQRLIVNYFTAKRLLQALAMSIQRHEHAFGVLETDVQKRVMPSLRRANAQA
jgi:Protein of unknown function (DUF3467)